MGLTSEVRNFFTNRIHALLDAKLAEIQKLIDRKKLTKLAVSRLFEQANLPLEHLERWEKIQEKQEILKKEESNIKNLVYGAIDNAFPHNSISHYSDDVVKNVECEAMRRFEDEITAEVYPDIVPQIAKINHIKEDVSSVVLLSTSETKLVQRLTTVLQKYGGDIGELLDYIPE